MFSVRIARTCVREVQKASASTSRGKMSYFCCLPLSRYMSSVHNALIMGPPGGGKGTISKYIEEDFNYPLASTGDMIRNQIRNETDIGVKFKEIVNAGKLAPADVVMELVKAELSNMGDKWMLDGFPRSKEQAELFDKEYDVGLVINIDVPQETILERLTARWCHMPSGRIYHTEFNPPKVPGKDDVTGEPLEQREDDKPETILRRLQLYEEETRPLIEYYDSKGVLKTFTGTESKKIYEQIRKYLVDDLGFEEPPPRTED